MLINCSHCNTRQYVPVDEASIGDGFSTACLRCQATIQVSGAANGGATAGTHDRDEIDLSLVVKPSGEGRPLTEQIAERLTQGAMSLQTIPSSAARIRRVAEFPQATLKQIFGVVVLDPAVTGKLLCEANSGFYANLDPVTRLEHVVERLGEPRIRALVLEMTSQPFAPADARYQKILQELWTHSYEVSLVSELVAGSIGYVRVPEARMAGLLHDIGRVFIIKTLDELSRADPRFRNLPEKLHQELIFVQHDEIGARLLEHCRVPEPIPSAVRLHHNPDKAKEGDRLPIIVLLANQVCRKLGLAGFTADPGYLLSTQHAVRTLGFDDLRLADLLIEVEDLLAARRRKSVSGELRALKSPSAP